MYPDDYNKQNNLYYSVNGEIGSLKDLTSISIEVSEEDQAKLWALFEGLEIVKEE